MFLALNPMTAVVLSWVLLGKRMDGKSWAALACIVTGLWISSQPPKNAVENEAARA